jgi:hypothetical protein
MSIGLQIYTIIHIVLSLAGIFELQNGEFRLR